jgi:hypothetical protein
LIRRRNADVESGNNSDGKGCDVRFGRRALRRLGVGTILLPLALLATTVTSAEAVTTSGPGCPQYALGQPFLRWLDPMFYTLAPNGGLESGSDAWTLTGDAVVTAGNETYQVSGASDMHSLLLPPDSSATTTPMCVAILDPTVRLFIVNTGSQRSRLEVEVLYTDAFAKSRSATVAILSGSPSWRPTLPLPFRAQFTHPPLVTEGTTWVAFRFTPLGTNGNWRIDNVFVDPFKGR